MVALNLQNEYESDSKAVKSLIRSTIRSAMNSPSNTNYNITSIKLDFSRGHLHIGDDDPRYVYHSPVMTIKTIPIGPTFDRETDVSNQSKMLEDETRKLSGSESGGGEISFETNPSMLNAMAGEPSEYDIYQAYLETNDLSEAECPFIFDQNDANHISQKDDVMRVEDGEKATTSVPQKAASEITSMNSFSNLKSVSSIISGKSDYVIHEIADELNDDDDADDDGEHDITSFTSSDETQSDEFFDVQIIDESHQNGTRQIFVRINNEICDELKNFVSDSIFNILFL
uniref:Uncharacterized protein n=1 Tax=Panagrolaimus davidi TaxID=227884 RepID=A0A914PUI0_9BILA